MWCDVDVVASVKCESVLGGLYQQQMGCISSVLGRRGGAERRGGRRVRV